MRAARVFVVLSVAMMVGGVREVRVSAAQVLQQQQPMSPGMQIPSASDATGGGDPRGNGTGSMGNEMEEHMRQQAILRENDVRHKRLSDDVTKLLALSTELKAEVDKAGKDELSLEVMRKADAIEKLAHDVKERERQ